MIVKSPETQIETHHTKPMFWDVTCTTDLDSLQYKKKKIDGKNDHIVQSSMFIVKTKDICPEYSQNLPRTSPKCAQNIPEIWLECLGDGQQVPVSPMKSPTVWGCFLGVAKSPNHQNGRYRDFFGGGRVPVQHSLFIIMVEALNKTISTTRDWIQLSILYNLNQASIHVPTFNFGMRHCNPPANMERGQNHK
jgi:hypothetical protein